MVAYSDQGLDKVVDAGVGMHPSVMSILPGIHMVENFLQVVDNTQEEVGIVPLVADTVPVEVGTVTRWTLPLC